jgi:hypothetical protein
MSIGGGKPEKEGLIFGTLPEMAYPVFRPSRSTSSSNLIKRTVLVPKHMILPREHGVVSNLPQKFRKADLLIRQSNMQFRGTGIVWIAPGNNTAPGGTAAVGSLDDRMTVTPKIILRNIIGDKEDNVWLFAKCISCANQTDAKKNPKAFDQN